MNFLILLPYRLGSARLTTLGFNLHGAEDGTQGFAHC